jgi:hypothetical protein
VVRTRRSREVRLFLEPGDNLNRVPAQDGDVGPVEGILQRRRDDVGGEISHALDPGVADVVASPLTVRR